VIGILQNELLYVSEQIGIGFRITPTRIWMKTKTRTPKPLDLFPLVIVRFLWGFESAAHPIGGHAALWTNPRAFLG